ncbi:MAG: response regulator [Gaiellaceae bacterium]
MPINVLLELRREKKPVSVLIVDDHPTFRTSARTLLESEGFSVVGEAASGTEGLDRVRELEPDLVLLDVQLPDIDGFEVALRLSTGEHPPAVILTSTRDRSDYGPRIDTSPACGFVPKSELSGARLTALLRSCA